MGPVISERARTQLSTVLAFSLKFSPLRALICKPLGRCVKENENLVAFSLSKWFTQSQGLQTLVNTFCMPVLFYEQKKTKWNMTLLLQILCSNDRFSKQEKIN